MTVFAISTGAIIAIAVVAAIILILLLVLLPKMRKQAAEKKAEKERRERERQLERERRGKADEHRSVADDQRHQAELAEAEAQRSRAEADINAKRAEMHESGLADEQLPSGTASASPNGRVDDRDHDQGVRDLGGGGRAHEPAQEGRAPESEYERGRQDGERVPDSGADRESGGRTLRPEDHNEVDEGRRGPLR